MAQNFIGCDREQELLLPPSLREWLPEGHLAWFVIDAVAELDLGAFYTVYRADGHGRADPAMMVALLLYAYAIGERSSRRIERRCAEDVATAGDLREPGARSHNDRAFPPAPRDGAGWIVG
jgi:transposase